VLVSESVETENDPVAEIRYDDQEFMCRLAGSVEVMIGEVLLILKVETFCISIQAIKSKK